MATGVNESKGIIDPPPLELAHGRRCWAQIDLAALERNLCHIRDQLPAGIRYVAVVKADAYGHGLYPTVSRLMQANVDLFAVSTSEEAGRIHEIARGWPILLLGFTLPGEEATIIQNGWMATVSSCEEINRFEKEAERLDKRLQVHLKIDTGMGRLGAWFEDTKPLYQKIMDSKNLVLRGIYTHFSDSVGSSDFTQLQRQRFLSTLQSLGLDETTPLMVHSDNSGGVEIFDRKSPINAVRVGLLQFGVVQYPLSVFKGIDIRPVFSLYSRIGLVKTVPAGTPISYNRTYVTRRETRIAVITAGYGDGIPTAISNKAQVLIQGKRCPLMGRITMDQMVADVTGMDELQPGEPVVLIGTNGNEKITVSDFSQWANSIPWEIFCNISKRVPRIYQTTRR